MPAHARTVRDATNAHARGAAEPRARTSPIAATLLALASLARAETLLQNTEFADWKDGVPAGWSVAKGAGAPSGEESLLRPLRSGGGFALSGDARTAVWRVLSQAVPSRPDAVLRLRFHARHSGLKREGAQFDNAWGGLWGVGEGAKFAFARFEDGLAEAWIPHEILLRPAAEQVEVRFFLSKTGLVEIQGVVLEELAPEQSLDALAAHMARYYSYFEHKGVDWEASVARHREAILESEGEAAFVEALRGLLAELKDAHVWMKGRDGKIVGTYGSKPGRNYDLKAVGASLKNVRQIGRVALAGTTADGFGYVAIGTLQLEEADVDRIVSEIDVRLDAPGFIVDLRGNTGGNERNAWPIAAIFADKSRVYAWSRTRNGPKPGDLCGRRPRLIEPREGKTFTKPVVVLLGPVCMSSGEQMAKMFDVLPHVTTVGKTTRGASGNPEWVELPNGVSVAFSRWVDEAADGTPIEGKGVKPDVEVEHEGEGDPTFEAGVNELKRRVEK